MTYFSLPRVTGALVATLVFGLSIPALAGEDPAMDRGAAVSATPAERQHFVQASEFIGMRVENSRGERLGTVDDLVLSSEGNRVSYIVLSSGGVLGIGDKNLAVPFRLFQHSPGQDVLTLNVDRETLRAAPGFNRANWPDVGNPQWSREVDRYYAKYGTETPPMRMDVETDKSYENGAYRSDCPFKSQPQRMEGTGSVNDKPLLSDKPRTGEKKTVREGVTGRTISREAMGSRRLSKIIGADVRNPGNRDLGEVNDVIIGMPDGHILYGIVSYGGVLGMGDRFAPVPFTAMNIERDRVVIDTDRQTLDQFAYEDEDSIPNLMDRQYADRLASAYGVEPYYQVYGYAPGEPRTAPPVDRPRGAPMTAERIWGKDGTIVKMYNPDKVTTLKGTIESVGAFRLGRDTPEGLRVRMHTTEGKHVTVWAGPYSYYEKQSIRLHPKDEVTVTGTLAKHTWRDVLVASEIRKGDQTLRLLTKDGTPLWNVNELAAPRGGTGGVNVEPARPAPGGGPTPASPVEP